MYIAGCAHRKRNKRVAPNIASVRTLVLVRHCPINISEMQVCGKRKTIRNEKNELQAAMVVSVWLTLCFLKSLSSVTLNIPDIFQRGREIKGNRKQKWLRHFSKRNTNENYFPNEKKKKKRKKGYLFRTESLDYFSFSTLRQWLLVVHLNVCLSRSWNPATSFWDHSDLLQDELIPRKKIFHLWWKLLSFSRILGNVHCPRWIFRHLCTQDPAVVISESLVRCASSR